MIINITGDEYGSILICTFFGFLHFLPFLAIFGIFGVSVGVGGFWGVLVSYKITRGIKSVVGWLNQFSILNILLLSYHKYICVISSQDYKENGHKIINICSET